MASAAENFYEFTNNWWLKDESVKIPPEYPRWGSFMQLHDESLKNQIKLLQEVAEVKEATVDEKKLGENHRPPSFLLSRLAAET